MRRPRPVGPMRIVSTLPDFPGTRIRHILTGLPRAKGYRLDIKPLRYRTSPHLAGLCDYDTRVITVQVPEPFRAFRARIPYRAKRLTVSLLPVRGPRAEGIGGDGL